MSLPITLKEAIISEIRKNKPEFENKADDYMVAELFLHPAALRLSYYGYIQCKDIFTSYSFNLDDSIKSKHLINLSKVMNYPYYLNTHKLILFSKSDSMMIKLSGSVNIFLESIS